MLASEIPTWPLRAFAFVFGAIWGSFANVVIYRWPRGMSIIAPGSHCFRCGKPVRAFDNVPILAWLWLRGRCRDCGARFSPRYALVELIFAVVSAAIAERTFFHPPADLVTPLTATAALGHYAVRFTVAFALLLATFIDLDEMIVPWFIKWFVPVPLLGAWLLPTLAPSVDLPTALLGAGIGYVGLRLLFIDGYKLLTGRPGMGLGDAEILLLVGALLGPAGVAFALGAGAVQGVIATLVAMALGTRIGPSHADQIEDDALDEHGNADEGKSAVHEREAHKGMSGPHNAATSASDERTATPLMHETAKGEPDVELPAPEGARLPATKVPFVPFLALAALEYMLGADVLVDNYLRMMRGE